MVKSLIYDTFYGTLSYNYLLHMLFFFIHMAKKWSV